MDISVCIDKCYGLTSAAKGRILELFTQCFLKRYLPTHAIIYPNYLSGNKRNGRHPDTDMLLPEYGTQIEIKNHGETSILRPGINVLSRYTSFHTSPTSLLKNLNPGKPISYKQKKKCTQLILVMAKENGLPQSDMKFLHSHNIKFYLLDKQILPINPTILFETFHKYTEFNFLGSLYQLLKLLSAFIEKYNELVYTILKASFDSDLFSRFEELILTLIRDLSLYTISEYHSLKGIHAIVSSLITNSVILFILRMLRISGKDPPLIQFFDCPILPLPTMSISNQKEGELQVCKQPNRVIAALKKQLREFIGEYETPISHQNKTCLEMAIEYFTGGEKA